VVENHMKTRIVAGTRFLGLLALAVGCSSSEQGDGSNGGGTGPVGGGGTNAAGAAAGGASGTGVTGGTSGTAGSGMSGSATGGTAAVSSGGGAGVSGSAPEGGTSGSSTGGGAGSETGGSSPGGSGTGGSSGSGGGKMGTATFTVMSQLASQVMATAPTTVGIVTWSIDVQNVASASIEFGLTTAYGMRAPVDLAAMNYRTLLLGMKPMNTYHFRVIATAGDTTYTSGDYTIQTGAPTTAVSIGSFNVRSAANRKPGFIVASYWRGDGTAVPFILDSDGVIVWWYTGGPLGIARASMSADGKNMWMASAANQGQPLRRVSMDGLDAQTYASAVSSHDITPVSGATMAYLEYGEADCDSIYEIDPSGTTREIWESQSVAQSGCHANALRYSQKENVFTFSDVNTDIFVVSRAGMLQWRLSEKTTGGNGSWGGTQHGHQLLDASILVFANKGGGAMASDFIEYDLMGREIARYTGGGFSANLGDVQRLPGGNTLVTYSNDGLIREIDAQRNVVLEIDGGNSSFGYSLWRESLYGPPPDISQ
jgi:hypothetical protein